MERLFICVRVCVYDSIDAAPVYELVAHFPSDSEDTVFIVFIFKEDTSHRLLLKLLR